jgi:anti-sigma factor RsiW
VTCREFVDFLLSYVEGGLKPPARARFDAHLADCPDCVRYLNQYSETIKASREVFADDDLAEVPVDLLRAILDSRRKAGGQTPRRSHGQRGGTRIPIRVIRVVRGSKLTTHRKWG